MGYFFAFRTLDRTYRQEAGQDVRQQSIDYLNAPARKAFLQQVAAHIQKRVEYVATIAQQHQAVIRQRPRYKADPETRVKQQQGFFSRRDVLVEI